MVDKVKEDVDDTLDGFRAEGVVDDHTKAIFSRSGQELVFAVFKPLQSSSVVDI